MATESSATAAKTPAQTFALVIGVVYLLVGIAGFFVAGEFTKGAEDDKLILFRLNHLHNIIHVALGAVWIAASRVHLQAKNINTVLGAVLLVVALLGFLASALGGQDGLTHVLLNIVSAGDPDNFLHLVTGAASVYFGTAGASGTRAAI